MKLENYLQIGNISQETHTSSFGPDISKDKHMDVLMELIRISKDAVAFCCVIKSLRTMTRKQHLIKKYFTKEMF